MEDKRITVKELKKWLEDKDDNAEIYLEKYTNVHSKEFLVVREWDEHGKLDDKELLVASVELDQRFVSESDD
jgi:hypothetical protein